MRPFQAIGIGLIAGVLALSAHTPVPAADELPEQAELRKLMDELHKAETALELQKRFLPPSLGFASVETETGLKGLAERAGIASIDVRPLPDSTSIPLPDGRPSSVALRPLDVSGRDSILNVARFLASLVMTERLIEFQTLDLESAAGDSVTFATRIGVAYCTDPCSGHVIAPQAAATLHDETLDKLLARQMVTVRQATLEHRALEKLLVDLGTRFRATRRLPAMLAALYWSDGEAPLALTRVQSHDKIVLQGVTLGVAASLALRPALEKAGFQVEGIRIAPAGRCLSFTATAKLKDGDPKPLPTGSRRAAIPRLRPAGSRSPFATWTLPPSSPRSTTSRARASSWTRTSAAASAWTPPARPWTRSSAR